MPQNNSRMTYSELKQILRSHSDITPFAAQVMLQKHTDIRLGCPFCHRSSGISHKAHWITETPDIDIEHLSCERCVDLLPENDFVSLAAKRCRMIDDSTDAFSLTLYISPRKPDKISENIFYLNSDLPDEITSLPLGTMGIFFIKWDVPFEEMLSQKQINFYSSLPDDYQ